MSDIDELTRLARLARWSDVDSSFDAGYAKAIADVCAWLNRKSRALRVLHMAAIAKSDALADAAVDIESGAAKGASDE